jgi:hypothetical protein
MSKKISKISSRFVLLFKILIVLYPVFVTCSWFNLIEMQKDYFSFSRLPVDVDISTLRFPIRLSAYLVNMIPVLFVMLGFYYLIQLFKLYARNIIFSFQNIFYIRKIALTLFLQVLAGILIQPFLSLILTFDAPKGGHTISIGAGSDEISSLIIAGIVLLISWIMEEGRRLEEESALTV